MANFRDCTVPEQKCGAAVQVWKSHGLERPGGSMLRLMLPHTLASSAITWVQKYFSCVPIGRRITQKPFSASRPLDIDSVIASGNTACLAPHVQPAKALQECVLHPSSDGRCRCRRPCQCLCILKIHDSRLLTLIRWPPSQRDVIEHTGLRSILDVAAAAVFPRAASLIFLHRLAGASKPN